jgi:hypothetical protein
LKCIVDHPYLITEITLPRFSLHAFWCCVFFLTATAFLYYPRWKQANTEATISWDVSGYYLYLPAALIYGDMKGLAFFPEIEQKYHPGPGMGQAFKDEKSGNYVMKYSAGQALQFLPWFLVAHIGASILGYPADGFSLPYQLAISWGSLFIAFLGLWFARKILLNYFSEKAVAAALFLMVFGSNYLNYTAIDGAMTHNWLFTLYCILVFATIQFYKKPSARYAILIGVLCGWATLTRPTELISLLIPLFWGFDRTRFAFFVKNFKLITYAVLSFLAVASVQLFYWKWATSQWVVYSYQDQGFDWLHPHFKEVLLGFRAGWLPYSPVMVFAVLGIYALWQRQRSIIWPILVFLSVFTYITCAWSIWWYGGSFGARAMIQSYALWLFPLAAFASWVMEQKWSSIVFPIVFGLMIGHNLWWTHQAHRGGLFIAEQMTQGYFFKVYGAEKAERDWAKLLDNRDEYRVNTRNNVREIWRNDFENDTLITANSLQLNGNKSLILNEQIQFSPKYILPATPTDGVSWLRVNLSAKCLQKEWEPWRMTQLIVRVMNDEKVIRERMIRLQRLLNTGETRQLFMEIKIPKQQYNKIEMYLWHAGGISELLVDDIVVEQFE